MNISDLFKIVILIALVLTIGTVCQVTARVIEEDDNTYLVDRRGERWDITQAVAIGFQPDSFEYGIGRNAIQPLDSSNLKEGSTFGDSGARVIGVENGNDAHAYVVRRMTSHEIANTNLGDTPIAAAY